MKKIMVIALLIATVFYFNTNSFAQTATATGTGTATASPTVNVTINPGETDPNLGKAALEQADNPNAYRNFAMGTPVTFANLISHFGPRSNSGGYQPVEELLLYVSIFTEGALEQVAAGKAEFSTVNAYKKFPKAGEVYDAKWIMIVIQDRKVVKDPATGKDVVIIKKYPGADFKGWVSAYGTKEKHKMQNVLANAALNALKAGCNILEVTMEGAAIDTISDGWGVGINANGAYMAPGSNQPSSFGSTVGAGYSTSQAGMRDLPWVNGNGLIVSDEVMKNLLASSLPKYNEWNPKDPAQTGNHVPKKQ